MASEDRYQTEAISRQSAAIEIDAGLRAHMLKVYNYMASGLALTGIMAMLTVNSESMANLFFQIEQGYLVGITGLGWVAVISPLAIVFAMSLGVNRFSASALQAMFWAYAGLMGISMATILLTYTGASVSRVFFITAGTFAGMSLYGYTTKRDLSGFGGFLMMGLIGIIIASIVNMFMQSSALYFAISVIGVLVFVGLTAYDTQKIKAMYAEADGTETTTKKAVMGALTLYLDFINLFIMLIRLFGERR